MMVLLLTAAHAESPGSNGPEFQKWSGKKGAVIFGISPIFSPKIGSSDRLNSNKFINFDLGLETKENMVVGIRYATATVPSLQIYDSLTFKTTYYPNASMFLLEPYAGINIPLNEPYTMMGLFQFFIPLRLGVVATSISASPNKYLGLGVDSSAGIGVRLYTKSIFRADLIAQYHFGVPLGEISDANYTTTTVQSTHGDTMKSSLTGFEFRIGFSILFPDSPESAKAREEQE
jgi:hypothetical protein